MEQASLALVIILAVTLTIFLWLSIVAMIFIMRVLKSIRQITLTAESLVDKAEEITEVMSHAAGPIVIGRALSVISDAFFGNKSKSKRK